MGDKPFDLPPRCHIAPLDDFGPEASLEVLSTFSTDNARLGKHRILVNSIVPIGLVNTGPGFSEYRRES